MWFDVELETWRIFRIVQFVARVVLLSGGKLGTIICY